MRNPFLDDIRECFIPDDTIDDFLRGFGPKYWKTNKYWVVFKKGTEEGRWTPEEWAAIRDFLKLVEGIETIPEDLFK